MLAGIIALPLAISLAIPDVSLGMTPDSLDADAAKNLYDLY